MEVMKRTALLLIPVLFASAAPAGAQDRPDAGRVLQETQPEITTPTPPSVDFQPSGAPLSEGRPGGQRVQIERLRFTGNTVFDDDTLEQVLGDEALPRSLDLAGLRGLANRVSRYYRAQGYPFARAVLPAQKLTDGELHVRVVEGRYGAVRAHGEDPALVTTAEGFLQGLEPGALIESDALTRAVMLLADLPGVEVDPVMRPGRETGTGDLAVDVRRGERWEGSLGLDNHGNRFSGEYRLRADLAYNGLLTPGDRFSMQGLVSNEELWLGALDYARPLGYSGLRGRLGISRTEYDLRSPYEGFTGTADMVEAGVSYPWLRSRDTNLTLEADYAHKWLDNAFDDVTYEDKTAHRLALGLRFDHRDRQGVTYGGVKVAPGVVETDVDDVPDGAFTKVEGRIGRRQALPAGLELRGHVQAQWADVSLDSSETLALGGAHGVRAYPQGEATGSRAWLSRFELHRGFGRLDPYLFYDAGRIEAFEQEEGRTLAGGGLGLGYRDGAWEADVVVAWSTRGGEPRSDDQGQDPRAWFTAAYRF